MAGRPISIEKQRKVAAVVEMNADGKKKHEIAQALGIDNRTVDVYLAQGRRIYVEQPTREAVNQHRERLEAILDVLEAQAMKGKLFSIDRYLQTLDRLGAITGVNYADRAKHMLPDSGAEIDRWLRGSVEDNDPELREDPDEWLERQNVVHEDDDEPARDRTLDEIEEELDIDRQFHTPNEPEKVTTGNSRKSARRN